MPKNAKVLSLLLVFTFSTVWLATGYSADLNSHFPSGFLNTDSGGVEPGVWSLGGASWDLTVAVLPPDQLQSRLVQTAKPDSNQNLGIEHLALFNSLRPQFQTLGRNGNTTSYGLDMPDMKSRLFSYLQGNTEVPLGAHIAVPRGPEGWTVLTVTPAAKSARSASRDASLLPLPQGFRRVCSRRRPDGKLQCDVISVRYSNDQMTRFWSKQGWRVEQPEWAGLGENEWLCFRDKQCVQISSQAAPNGQGTSWVMVTSDAAKNHKSN